MKVFFHAYIRCPENYLDYYQKIYHAIEELDYQHVSNFIIKTDSKAFLQKLDRGGERGHASRVNIYTNTLMHIKKADIVVIEISMHSLSSGYLMHEALDHEKPVIALYHEGFDPYYLVNMTKEKLQYVEYNSTNIKSQLKKALDNANKMIDVRFNFFITPQIINYMNWTCNTRRISKSDYIRNLIMTDMRKNRDYKREIRK